MVPVASHAIVVEVERPNPGICFIVTPYAPEFDHLCQIIESASNVTGLKPVQTRHLAQGIDFHAETYRLVRQATLVVVVCTPEHNSPATNRNVVYELGLASSLRKPTIVLTTSPRDLPSDLGTLSVLQYSVTELGGRELVTRIAGEMTKLQPHWSANQLTDARATDVWVASFEDARYLKTSFWAPLRNVLKATISSRQELSLILQDKLGPLKKQARRLSVASNEGAAFQLCEAWAEYQKWHRAKLITITTEFVTRWSLFLNSLSSAGAGPRSASWLTVEEFYRSTQESIQSLLAAQRNADQIVAQGKEDLTRMIQIRGVVSAKFLVLHDTVSAVCVDMDNLLQKLIDAIAVGIEGIASR